MPLFSIVIPVYNSAVYLDKCLKSAASQNYDDYEIICVDDGSTDGSNDILQRYAALYPHLKIIQQQNQGVGSARNNGIKAAQGDYIIFLDSDDWIEDNLLSQLVPFTDRYDIICFNGRRYFEQTQQYECADPMRDETDLSGWDYYCRHALEPRHFAFVCVVLRCYQRTFLLQNNLFFNEGIYHEDNLFTPIACYQAHHIAVIGCSLYTYRIHENSVMTSRSIVHWQNLITAANLLTNFFVDKDNIDRTVIYRIITHHYQVAMGFCNRNDIATLATHIDWEAYHCVSRTKLRHRLQYQLIRHTPTLFRLLQAGLRSKVKGQESKV